MIDSKTISLNYIKKADLPGSDAGIRFLMRKVSVDDTAMLRTFIWPEPFSLAKTDPSLVTQKDFPLTQEGKEEAVAFVNSEKEAHPERYGISAMQAVSSLLESRD